MQIEKEIVEKLLDQLNEYISDIENMNFTEDDLYKKRDIEHLLSHRLHIAVEICIDIANHIVSALEIPGRESASDVIMLLGTNNIVEEAFAEKFIEAPKLRNLLIHGYDNIDYRMLYKDYRNDLSDLKEFARQIKKYLEKN